MCILFFQLNTTSQEGAYHLILVNNRDECWDRPTATVDFWGKDNNCISSLDMEPGREGGTWIGMNKQGQIGALLNILGETLPHRKGRGFLVRDFITSKSTSEEFLKKLAKDVEQSSYNGFHLVLLELGKSPRVQFLTEIEKEERKGVRTLPAGVHAFGNSQVEKPWQKVCKGKLRFEKILEDSGRPENKEKLVESLMDFLNDDTPYLTDGVLEPVAKSLHMPEDVTHERSANRVWSPNIRYGTRTNTVILVDWSGTCEYIERSLVMPVDAANPVTETKSVSFKLDINLPDAS